MPFRSACFERSSATYEAVAHIQRRLAERLVASCRIGNPKSILELGCGTGVLTRKMGRRFPSALIVATDSAPRMLERARFVRAFGPEVLFEQQDADGSKPIANRVVLHAPYDLITTSALLQWIPDLDAHLRLIANLVTSESRYVFSAFTPANLPELNALLAAPPFSYGTFPGVEPGELETLARQSGWMLEELYESEDREVMPSPLAVLRHIQAMGASRDPRRGGRLTRGTLQQLLSAYGERYAVDGGVSLSWHSCVAVLRPS